MNPDYNQKTKAQIVEHAISLFKERGFSNVSISEICTSLDISRSAFYYYFKTKDEVIDHYRLLPEPYIIEHIFPVLTKTTSYVSMLFSIFEAYSKEMLNLGPELLQLVLKRNIEGKSHDRNPRNLFTWPMYANLIQRGQESGEILNTSSAELLADTLVFVANGVTAEWCNKNGAFDYNKKCEELFCSILAANAPTLKNTIDKE